ncbi:DNA-protecting protein DprA [Campylobacter coli]|nr:DNA-protecting protein DprA [Campylobacter coli]
MLSLNAINLYEEMLKYEFIWSSIKNSSLKKFKDLQVIQQDFTSQDAKEKIQDFLLNLDKKDFSILTEYNYQFPKNLKNTYIKSLYYKGNLDLLSEPKKIAIVGVRNATEDGIKRAIKLSKELSSKGFVIVSGLAHGIDTAAMRSTIKNNGSLIGVIGTPINEYYPIENKALQDEIANKHLLVSHVPFYKYSIQPFSTKKFYFPERNAVMAAISDATVIVEASETSGTLTQARACIEIGRKLFILNSCFENGLKWPYTYEKKGAIRVKKLKIFWIIYEAY